MGSRSGQEHNILLFDVFESDPALLEAVNSITARYPATLPVFQRVVQHFQNDAAIERPSKRIKTEQFEPQQIKHEDRKTGTNKDVDGDGQTMLTIKDISFVTPIRKKLTLHINKDSLKAHQNDSLIADVQIPLHEIALIALLPVPEKATKQHNFCIFKNRSDNAIVFTVPDTPPKGASGSALTNFYASSFKALITQTLQSIAPALCISEPNTSDFTSAIPQAHRKNEPALHVVAHRGSKEGYLFFLPTGLVYGFKKPLLYIPLNRILSVTYNDILQRTFNLTIAVQDDSQSESKKEKEQDQKAKEMQEEPEEIEFSMIDAAEHDAVDKYINKYRLCNSSLSDARRARPVSTKLRSAVEESEISKAANAIAASVTGQEMPCSDEEEDADFTDDESHSGSTVASDDDDDDDGGFHTGAEDSDAGRGDIDIELASDATSDDDDNGGSG